MSENDQRPRGRKRKITGEASVGARKGEGLGTGPVGNREENQDGRTQQGSAPQRPQGMNRPQQGFPQGMNRPQQPQRPQQGDPQGMNRPQQGTQRPQQGYPQGMNRPQQGTQRPQQGYPQGMNRPQSSSGNRASSPMGGGSSGGGLGKLLPIIIAAAVLLLGGGGLSGLFGGGGSDNGGSYPPSYTAAPYTSTVTQAPSSSSGGGLEDLLTGMGGAGSGSILGGSDGGFSIFDLIGGASSMPMTSGLSTASSSFGNSSDSMQLDRSVVSGARAKYTKLLGNGQDTVTLMLYMCGSDLESRSAMASRDLQEIAKAKYGDNVQVIVYTGGASSWHIRNISSQVNQIWRVRNGRLEQLSANEGTAAMTNPDTLSGFIAYCKKNYPASRYALILWDHGGGSVSGYGHDEKNTRAGSMTLPNIQKALKNGGVKFDFIGFDACLMATVETALTCADYADYLIASEETEPGIGWYYTDWMTTLGNNTSIATIDLGKEVCDSFVSACQTGARGQMTTLSVVDLAEFSKTVPTQLNAFSKTVTGLVKDGNYKQVSDARYGAREFAASTRIDQVDLSDLAQRVGGDAAQGLVSAIDGAVKYNRSGSLTGAHGLSIYFPYRKAGNVDKAVNSNNAIGMDASYSECIRAFASVEVSGQAAMGGTSSPYSSLSGASYSSSSGDMISSLLGMFLGGDTSSMGGMGSLDFLSGRVMSDDALAAYISGNALDGAKLRFEDNANGEKVLSLTAEQWALIHDVDLNLFVDDGEGYMDLGLDNVFDEDGQGGLVADTSRAWIALNGHLVAYYREESAGGSTWGYIPVLLNGARADLLTLYTEEDGFTVIGARVLNEEGETVGKAFGTTAYGADEEGEMAITGDVTEFIGPRTQIQPVCDYYRYDGTYVDSFRFGDSFTAADGLAITEVVITNSKLLLTYRLTDIYQQAWWTDAYTL